MPGRTKIWAIASSTALCAALLVSCPATASLIGESVRGSLGTNQPQGVTITTQFLARATVGAGVEFSGVAQDVFGQIWNVTVDIGATSFVVSWTSSTQNANVGDGAGLLTLSLSDLDMPGAVTGVINSGYSCVPTGPNVCTGPPPPGPHLSSLTFGTHSIDVGWDTMWNAEMYSFDIESQPQQAPEPATLFLFGVGFVALVGTVAWRKGRSIR